MCVLFAFLKSSRMSYGFFDLLNICLPSLELLKLCFSMINLIHGSDQNKSEQGPGSYLKATQSSTIHSRDKRLNITFLISK